MAHLVRGAALGNVDRAGQSAAAERVESDLRHDVALGSERSGDTGRGVELDAVPLTVVEGQRIALVPVAERQGQAGGRIETSAEEADGFRGHNSSVARAGERTGDDMMVSPGSPLRFRFLTSTPLDITRGSGTFVGITVLAGALRKLGHTVDFEFPRRHLPVYTLERLWFNRGLRRSDAYDLTVGFDMDGYRIAGPRHVASLKGVIADELVWERGLTRATMGVQAHCERLHVHRAGRVVTCSRYSAIRAAELYGLAQEPAAVPEPIDLARWRAQLSEHPAQASRFTVLNVGRFYPRKRVDILLRAAARLRAKIPELEVRIVGNGPCNRRWRRLADELNLEGAVTWLGDVSRAELAAEYNRCHVFCMPSVQEAFGIVLLEAMAAAKPIVASRAAAIPEVARYARLIKADNVDALAEGLYEEYRKAGDFVNGSKWVERFDALRVAAHFAAAVSGEPVPDSLG